MLTAFALGTMLTPPPRVCSCRRAFSENNALSQGMEIYRTIVEKPGSKVNHLNPRTMDE